MLLNDPKKFISENAINNAISTDNTLIAQCDIIIQYNENVEADLTNKNWISEKNYNPTKIYNWIRISFDGGNTFPFIYKLNTTKFSEQFPLSACVNTASETEYPYSYSLSGVNTQLFNYLKNSPLTVSVGNENETLNIFTPIKWNNTDSSITVYFSENFYNNYTNLICFISN